MQVTVLIGFLVLILSIGYYVLVILNPVKRGLDTDDEDQTEEGEEPEIVGGNRMKERLRKRNQMNAQQNNEHELMEDDNLQQEPGAAPQTELELLEKQMQQVTDKKEYRRLQKRQERLQQKEQMQAYQQDQLTMKVKRDEEREQKEYERERQQIEEEEAEQKAEEEKREKEKQEFELWSGQINIEEEGVMTQDDEQTIQEFVDYIKKRKVVMLEDVAAQFNLKTTDVVQRIEKLESENKLTGITDDRGKYIYITESEFDGVTRYIEAKGRVSRADLLYECNKLIRMEPTAQDKKIIEEQQKALVNQVKASLDNKDD